MSRYLVTGGAGFIGSNIVELLVEQGNLVRVLDNNLTEGLGNLRNVIHHVEFIQGDIRNLTTVREAVKDMDYVLHHAALVSVDWSVKDPIYVNEVNDRGTLNVLVAAKDTGVKRVVCASSASVYGDSEDLPKREDMHPDPVSPYAISKYTGELYCRAFYTMYGLETVVLRYFNVFGPRQNPNSQYAAAIPIFIKSFLKGKSPTIFGDGEQSRDFVFVRDVAQANLAACHAESAAGEVLNIACGERTTINSLVKLIGDLLKVDVEPIYGAERPGDVRHSQADTAKAREILGYSPEVDLETGLKTTIEWFQANRFIENDHT